MWNSAPCSPLLATVCPDIVLHHETRHIHSVHQFRMPPHPHRLSESKHSFKHNGATLYLRWRL